MTKIYTPNIVITTNFNVASKLDDTLRGAKDNTFSNLAEFYEVVERDTESFVLTNKDGGFESLEFTMGEKEHSYNILISLLDPNRDFEIKFLREPFIEAITNLDTNLPPEEKRDFISNLLDPDDYLIEFREAEELLRHKTTGTNRRYYIAFGSSEDFKDWAGPFNCCLMGTRTDITSEGSKSKTILLDFVPTNGIAGADSTLFDPDKFTKEYPDNSLEVNGKWVYSENNRFYDVHIAVTSCLNAFLKTIYNTSNVIVLLKDLQKSCYPSIAGVRNRLFGQTKDLTGLGEILSEIPAQIFGEAYRGEEQARYFEDLMLLFGLDSSIRDRARELFIFPEKAYEVVPKNPFEYASCIRLQSDNNLAQIIKEKLIFLKRKLTRIHISNVSIVEYTETDMKTLKLWKSFGWIEDATKPAVIFGDEGLIKTFLYGANEIFSSEELEELEITDLRKVLHKTDTDKEFWRLSRPELSEESNLDNLKVLGDSETLKQLSLLYRKFENESFDSTQDEFSIEGDLPLTLEKLNLFPVFKFNISNPNVINFSVNNNAFYLTYLNRATKIRQDYASARTLETFSKGEAATYKYPEFTKDVEEYLTKFITSHGVEKSIDELEKIIKFADPETYTHRKDSLYTTNGVVEANLYKSEEDSTTFDPWSLHKGLQKVGEVPLYEFLSDWIYAKDQELHEERVFNNLEKSYGKSPVTAQLDIFKAMAQLAFTIEIDTLPMFSISNLAYIAFPCLFFYKAIQTVKYEERLGFLDSYLSGSYLITEVKHVMNTSEMKSSFKLLKNTFLTKEKDK